MEDPSRTNQELLEENSFLRQKIQELEQSESERKRTEEALRKSEEKYRLLIENSHDIIYTLTADGVFTFVSPGWTALLGHPVTQVAGQPFQPFVHPDDLAGCMVFLQRVIETGQRQEGVEYRVRHIDGSWRWHTSSAVPLRDEAGTIIGFEGTARDITAQKQAEEELRENERKYRSLYQEFRAILDAIPASVLLSPDLRIVWANERAAADMNISLSDFIGQYCYQARHARSEPCEICPVRGCFTSGKPTSGESITSDGRIWEVHASPLFGDHGEVTGVIEVARDISERKQAEEALRESQQIIEGIINAIPVRVFWKDKNLVYLGCNAVFAHDAGFADPKDIIGKDDYQMGWRDQAELYRGDDRQVIESGCSKFLIEEPQTTPEGNTITLLTSKIPLLSSKGEISGVLGTYMDITERKRAEEALRESEQRLHSIINGSPIPTFVIGKDHRVIHWNKALEEISSIKSEEVVGTCTHWRAFYNVERPCMADLLVDEAVELVPQWYSGKYVKPPLIEDACEATDFFPALGENGKWLRFTAGAIRDSKGIVLAAIETLEDVTIRKLAEEKYRNIFENAVMGIFQATPEGRIISANPAFARLLGYESPEEVVNTVTDMARQMYVNPERCSELLNLMNEQGTIQGHEIQFFRKDRSIVWTNMSGRAVRDNSKKLLYYEGTIQDITDRKLLESHLSHAQKMEAIGTLAGGIAHDFNNILSAILGYTEMALGAMDKNSPLRRYLDQVYKAGERARDLVKQILDFSRQSDQKPRPLRVSPIIKEVLKLLRASLPTTITIRQDIQSDLDTVFADPTQIHQIMMNLCTNAVHAMREKKGELNIRLVPVEIKDSDALSIQHGVTPGMYLKLTVSDTGHGIDPVIVERIFDPFFTTKKQGEGTGLGLSVVYGIIKSYGGTINVKSEVGKGTEFRVHLPLLVDAEGEREEKVAAHIVGGEECILFVDDEEALVNLGKDMLTGLGYQVVGRTSSLEALELFRSRPDRFDLVITDMTMPNMTGIELTQEIMRIQPGIPVILCTGFSEAITPEKAKALGLREFIMKPIIKNQIASAIRQVLDKKE
ncbi:MAG: PAS domain S-box protein [Deltaproteobacteria bacterium]|nr:PAS domain S-box protein [Deltaproteobacteria bacterium]